MVEYLSAEYVKRLMNKAGTESRPFFFAVDYEMERALFVESPMNQNDILFRFGKLKNYPSPDHTIIRDSLKIIDPISFDTYRKKFSIIMSGLLRGDSYLANLTARTGVETTLKLSEIMVSSCSPFGICVNEEFVSFSPERFVRTENDIISSFPMKGTIDASLPDAGRRILDNYKESCEHNTIVDLIRNDLGIVSDNVWVERFRYIDKVKTDRGEILQVSSEIRGRLSRNYEGKPGDTIFALLPAGSVSGAPKPSTIKLITFAEAQKRGFYTGVAGYFDGKTLDSMVLIRYVEKDPTGKLFYRSGGGVTVNSVCEEEYKELLEKIYLPESIS
jgi:para-aminobenzoate synthetase component 1